MALPTPSELFTIPAQQDVLDGEVLPILRGKELKVNDWTEHAVYRAFAFIVSFMRVDVRIAVATFVAAGFEDYVFGFAVTPFGITVPDEWATLVAKQRYGLDRIEATYTKRRFLLSNSVNTAYGPIAAGNLTALMSSGNRYILDEEITVPALGSVSAIFRSEFPNNSDENLVYNDPSDDLIILVTTDYSGLTATNPSATFSDVAKSGSGVGLVTPTGSPVDSFSFVVRIDTTGQAAAIAWSTSINGGPFVARSGASAVNVDGTGVTITLTNNSGDPAFAAGASYYFNTPGSDVTQPGRDRETAPELGTRCRSLIPNLALVKDDAGNYVPLSPTKSAYELLARQFSDQVKICYVGIGSVNNEVIIGVAGQGALLAPSTLAALQTAFRYLNMITDYVVIVSPVLRQILLSNLVITVRSGMKATAQAAVQRALLRYFTGVDDREPLNPNGLIEHGYITSLIVSQPGVLRINDAAWLLATNISTPSTSDLQLPITAGTIEMARWEQLIATSATWVEE